MFSFFIFVVIPVAIYPLLIAIAKRFFSERIDLSTWLKWSPLFSGFVFAGLFWGLHFRTGSKLNHIFMSFSIVFGFALSLVSFTKVQTNILMFFFIMGGGLVIYGVLKLILFLKRYPIKTSENSLGQNR